MILLGTRCYSRGWLYRDVIDSHVLRIKLLHLKHNVWENLQAWDLVFCNVILKNDPNLSVQNMAFHILLNFISTAGVSIQALSGKGKEEEMWFSKKPVYFNPESFVCLVRLGWSRSSKKHPKDWHFSPPPHQLYVLLIIVYLSYVTALKCCLFWKS